MDVRSRLRRLLSPIVWRLLPNLYLREADVRRILLVKTGSLRQSWDVLGAIEKRFPGARITVLTEEREFSQLQSDGRVAGVTFYRNIRQFPFLCWQLRKANYDLKVVLFTKEATYEKFKALSILLHARKMLVYNEHGDSVYWGLRDLRGVWTMNAAGAFRRTLTLGLRQQGLLVVRVVLWPLIIAYLVFWAAVVLARYRLGSPKQRQEHFG